jgi:hypothetical protein
MEMSARIKAILNQGFVSQTVASSAMYIYTEITASKLPNLASSTTLENKPQQPLTKTG